MFGNFFGIDNNSLPQKKGADNGAVGNALMNLLQKNLLSAPKTVEKPKSEPAQRVEFSAPTAVGVSSFDMDDVVRRHKRLAEEIARKSAENG